MSKPTVHFRQHRCQFSRRAFIALMPGAAAAIAGCSAVPTTSAPTATFAPSQASRTDAPTVTRRVVRYDTRERSGTIVIDPANHYLHLVQVGGHAMQYGVGVGREGFGWSGIATVHDKQEWPDWYPPKDMLERKPDIRPAMTEMPGGLGMRGGPENPLGARALYLWQGNVDTLYRIHGTNEPWTIGQNVSSGCIRLTNDDVIDLYGRVPVGTRVVVLATSTA